MGLDIGLVGELAVQLRLAEMGWRPVALDARRTAVNVDLFALKGEKRVAIQVKATGAGHSHANSLGFGNAGPYLKNGTPFFNSKESPLIADLVVAVSYDPENTRFVILPVPVIEQLCQTHSDYWRSIPAKKRNTGEPGERSDSFPIYLGFRKIRRTNADHHSQMQRNLLAFEDRWELLEEPMERLHDPTLWPILA